MFEVSFQQSGGVSEFTYLGKVVYFLIKARTDYSVSLTAALLNICWVHIFNVVKWLKRRYFSAPSPGEEFGLQVLIFHVSVQLPIIREMAGGIEI